MQSTAATTKETKCSQASKTTDFFLPEPGLS